MLTRDLFKKILLVPARKADTLVIVAGYASPMMVKEHFEKLPAGIKVQLLIGMSSIEGVKRLNHVAFKKLEGEDLLGRFECRYIDHLPAVHSKVYVWLKNGRPKLAFIGSANYSKEAFLYRREILIPGDAVAAARYCASLRADSVSCLAADVEDRVRLTEFERRQPTHRAPRPARILTTRRVAAPEFSPDAESVRVSLLTKRGEVGDHSGLNWSQRPERKRQNEAYIPIPSALGKSGFFPPKAQPFILVTDDGQAIDAVIAQDGNKAIHSHKDNTILGRYFRARLGLDLNAKITRADLERYGRTDVVFQKTAEDTYLMDFAPPTA